MSRYKYFNCEQRVKNVVVVCVVDMSGCLQHDECLHRKQTNSIRLMADNSVYVYDNE